MLEIKTIIISVKVLTAKSHDESSLCVYVHFFLLVE